MFHQVQHRLRQETERLGRIEYSLSSGTSDQVEATYLPGLDNSIIIDIIMKDNIFDPLKEIRRNPENVRFSDLAKICERFFGPPRQKGSSHWIYRTPWQGDPGINIQDCRGKAKAYQVKQVLAPIDKLEKEHEHEP